MVQKGVGLEVRGKKLEMVWKKFGLGRREREKKEVVWVVPEVKWAGRGRWTLTKGKFGWKEEGVAGRACWVDGRDVVVWAEGN